MDKLDKVIAGLECHRGLGERRCESDCPYFKGYYLDDCFDDLREDALGVIHDLTERLKQAKDGRLELGRQYQELEEKLHRTEDELADRRKDIEVLTEALEGAHEETHRLIEERARLQGSLLALCRSTEYCEIYPLTVVCDRYTGTYSGGSYTAWNLDPWDIPQEIEGSDGECREFWWSEAAERYKVGKGATVAAAVANLYRKVVEEVADAEG